MKRWTLLFVLLLCACGTGAPENSEQLDLVVTSYKPDFAFKQVSTYAMPDKVVVISDPGTTPTQVDPALSQDVLNQISSQLNSLGYVPVATGGNAKPDLFVEVSQMTTVNTQVYYSYWPTYWGSYYAPYYGGAYGVGWSSTSYPYVTTATLGSLIINVTDPNHPDPATQKIPSVWAAVLNGVVDNATTADIERRVNAGIQQAFAQSPYFSKKAP